MESLLRDVAHAARSLRRAPGFTFVVVSTLALAIAGAAVIASLVDAMIVRPLPYPEADRIVRLFETNLERGWDQFSVSAPNYLDWVEQSRSFSTLAAWRGRSFTLTGGQETERVGGGMASASLFTLLGARPAAGRLFAGPDEVPGSGGAVAVISDGLWRRRFGADPSILGRTIEADGEPRVIVGILDPSFQWSPNADLFVPLGPALDDNRANHVLTVFGRLAPGVTLEGARAEMESIAGALGAAHPGSNRGWGVRAERMDLWIVGPDARRALAVLAAAVAAVLLIACANVACLQLIRGSGRLREIAIRSALGAGRLRVARQLLTESLVLSLAGGAAGVLLAGWVLDVVKAAGGSRIPRLDEAVLDLRVLAAAAGLSVAIGVLFGVSPALQAARADVARALAEGGRAGTGRSRQRLRQALVVLELAVSLVLLAAAGLLVRSAWRLQGVDPGFRSEGLATMQVNLPDRRYRTPEQSSAFHDRLLERLSGAPGFTSVAMATILPMEGGNTAIDLVLEGAEARPEAPPSADWRMISPGYFATMGIPLLSGRDFDARDAAGGERSVIVTREMARRYWPDRDPIGRRLRAGTAQDWWTVVGVAGDVKHLALEDAERPLMYLPAAQSAWNPMSLVVRTAAPLPSALATVQAAARSIDPDVAVSSPVSAEELLDRSTAGRRFSMGLLAAFSLVSLLLAAVGSYGVMAWSVTQRMHEFGIRMALGARGRDIAGLVARQASQLAMIAILAGLPAAFLSARLLSSMLFGVTPTDAATFAGVSLVLAASVAAAAWWPSRRAARADVLALLRHDGA
ncbi:MAG TPA: ABC transporter permease [Candidatus Polarisedimenticolia bacterium]|nr:ABC transporter permease [Candidatus Polarisedimenticolia bacterium]